MEIASAGRYLETCALQVRFTIQARKACMHGNLPHDCAQHDPNGGTKLGIAGPLKLLTCVKIWFQN
eukprot:1888850-Amphidinium_carterae.1